MKYGKILVPYDGSKYAEKAFDDALDIASRFDAKITTLTVLQAKMDYSDVSQKDLEEILEKQVSKIVTLVKKLEKKAKRINVELFMKIIYRPSSSKGIVEYADTNNFDLIVMGSHGRAGLQKVVLGSVAAKVVGDAKCPILITKGTK